MNKKYLLLIIALMFSFVKVNAETCPLDKQTTINNEAGSVTAKAYPYGNERFYNDDDTGDTGTTTYYYGMIDIYNLTDNLYAVLEYDDKKIRIDYNGGDTVSYTTGNMTNVRDCTISIYAKNSACGKTAIRTLNVVVPRENEYYSSEACAEYPDYFYCAQFMTTDSVTYDDFITGVENYAKTHKSKSEEERKEGFIEETTNFIKKNWLIVTIVVVAIAGGIITFIYIKNKKRKEQVI